MKGITLAEPNDSNRNALVPYHQHPLAVKPQQVQVHTDPIIEGQFQAVENEKHGSYFQTFKNAAMWALDKLSDPTIQAMTRMGVDEVSQALKAFPDSIGYNPEPGAPFEPTPHEVYEQKHDLEPLQAFQRDLPQPEVSQEKERSR
ncbi:MAG: hypothetical protein IT422_15720 [Pirellulaceae bacterium]|nr:hypothetical protein [Pirellulaceae bacterium]